MAFLQEIKRDGQNLTIHLSLGSHDGEDWRATAIANFAGTFAAAAGVEALRKAYQHELAVVRGEAENEGFERGLKQGRRELFAELRAKKLKHRRGIPGKKLDARPAGG